MPQFGETIRSALPQDIPWFLPDYAIFFSVFYLVLFVVGGGLGYVLYSTWKETQVSPSPVAVEMNRKE